MATQPGINVVGGMAEKVAPGISLPILFNVVLPGGVATAAIYNFTWLRNAAPLSADFQTHWFDLIALIMMIVILGALTSAISHQIYALYVGKLFWPRALFRKGVAMQQSRVEKLYGRAEKATAEQDDDSYDEAWSRLRIYPLNSEGKPFATYPSLLGNLVDAYEKYPLGRYGMDAVFYWPRLWLQIEKDKKEEISKQWSVADGLLSISAAALFGGLLWIVVALARIVRLIPNVHLPMATFGRTFIAGMGWLVLSYALYRVSLPFHLRNGEVFKSLFDLYRDRLQLMTHFAPSEAATWTATWALLQYYKLVCPNPDCGAYNSGFAKECGECHHDVRNVMKGFRASGKLPL